MDLQSTEALQRPRTPFMADSTGLEPATHRLTADCSTIELRANNLVLMDGFEPSTFRLSVGCSATELH